MLRTTILLLHITLTAGLCAQPTSGEVIYQYQQKLNDVTIPRDATLLFTDTASVFYHSRGTGIVTVDIDGRTGGPLMSYTSGPEHNGKSTIDFYKKDALGHTFYVDRKGRRMVAREIIYFRSFLYEEPELPKQEWHLVDSTKIIGDYLCRAAASRFRGREYFVWYTPEIPYPYGPWKLSGLPGLILEASDDENRIVYKASSIRFGLNNKKKRAIAPPHRAKREITFEEYKTIHWKEQLRINRMTESTSDRGSQISGISRHATLEIFD